VKKLYPISILQAINVCLCLMVFPYLLSATFAGWNINLWVSYGAGFLLGAGFFGLTYSQTKHIYLFSFEKQQDNQQ